jgi:uncharacterized protein (TIGR02588 family)
VKEITKAKRRTERRPAAEWATLIVSAAVVVGLIALVALQFGANGEVRIEVAPRIEDVREAGGLHYLPLEIANRGGPTALDVIVRVTSGEETVEIAIDILAGGGSEEVMAVFRSRPTQVDARVVSFRSP